MKWTAKYWTPNGWFDTYMNEGYFFVRACVRTWKCINKHEGKKAFYIIVPTKTWRCKEEKE